MHDLSFCIAPQPNKKGDCASDVSRVLHAMRAQYHQMFANGCVYCTDTLNHNTRVTFCNHCKLESCDRCCIIALGHAFSNYSNTVTPMACWGCRTPAVPCFAQVVANPAMLSAVQSSNAHAFWRAVGLDKPPPESVSTWLFTLYIGCALFMRMVRNDTKQTIVRYASLRTTDRRNSVLAEWVQGALSDQARFDAVPAWRS